MTQNKIETYWNTSIAQQDLLQFIFKVICIGCFKDLKVWAVTNYICEKL